MYVPASRAQAQKIGGKPRLDRVLGRRDLILLFVVAVANLNIIPAIASSGPVILWLWIMALLLYFWPQGAAVAELSAIWPNEGGVYLWARNSFGEPHGFLAGWCYWLSNVFYLPTVLLSCIGVGVYVFGPRVQHLADSHDFTSIASILILLVLLIINIRGLDLGKWVNNLGGIGTVAAAVIVCVLALLTLRLHGSALHAPDFKPHLADWHLLATFGIICYSLQGLDLASIMGDEIKEPRKILPGAIFWGGLLSGLIYLGVTFSMLVAMPGKDIGVLSGVLQAINLMADRAGWLNVVAPLALLECIAILGTASAWFSGSARLPFVAGIDRYLPATLGKTHPRYHTPYLALILFALLSCLLIGMSFWGASVGEAYLTLLDLAVILQMVPNTYMFAALLKHALAANSIGQQARPSAGAMTRGRRAYSLTVAILGLASSVLGICVAFIPLTQVASVWLYEFKLVGACALVFGAAFYFYFRHAASRQ